MATRSCRRGGRAARGDDPYLVVAADKGTATFSDTANAISAEHGYLARRCFRERRLGRLRPQEDGHHRARRLGSGEAAFPRNGCRHHGHAFHRGRRRRHVRRCLRQRHAALAGDQARRRLRPPRHLHRSRAGCRGDLAERRRLFDLPRSSWQDYDRSTISKGGGVFSRQEKAIRLGREAKALLDLPADTASPQELIQAILKMPGRPPLLRRHRHLRARQPTRATARSATGPMMPSGSRRRSSARASSARAPISP